MLAYRHAFHAGNHADVLKHIVLMRVLRYLNQKDKPYRLVDTHAGAGGYSLESRYAKTNSEASSGIERLWERDDLPLPPRNTSFAPTTDCAADEGAWCARGPFFNLHVAQADRGHAALGR